MPGIKVRDGYDFAACYASASPSVLSWSEIDITLRPLSATKSINSDGVKRPSDANVCKCKSTSAAIISPCIEFICGPESYWVEFVPGKSFWLDILYSRRDTSQMV